MVVNFSNLDEDQKSETLTIANEFRAQQKNLKWQQSRILCQSDKPPQQVVEKNTTSKQKKRLSSGKHLKHAASGAVVSQHFTKYVPLDAFMTMQSQ